jgi:hypothetical protein
MGNCKDCIHYFKSDGECALLVDLGENVFSPPPDKLASYAVKVSDDTGLSISVKFGPLFGCVNFSG